MAKTKRLSFDDRYTHSSSSSFANSIESGVSQHRGRRVPVQGMMDSVDYYCDEDMVHGVLDHEYIHQARDTLIHELYQNEKAYVESLDLLVKLFIQPLRQQLEPPPNSRFPRATKTPVCTQREMRWLFCNLEDIHRFHRSILTVVEQRLRIFGPTQIISDILHDHIFEHLGKYYGTYLDRYDIIITTYSRLQKYAPFRKFVEATQRDERLKGANLLSLLQIPAGCISSYAQIFIQLANATPPDHPDYAGLYHVKRSIFGLYEEIRPKIDQADNIDQVLMLHQAFVDAPFDLHEDRRLILQGELTRVSAKAQQSTRHYSLLSLDALRNPVQRLSAAADSAKNERLVILFSDLLLYVQARQEAKRTVLVYKDHMDLHYAQVRALPVEEIGLPHCFEITSSFTGIDALSGTWVASPRSHTLQTRNAEEEENWVYQLSSVIAELAKGNVRMRQRQGSDQSDRTNRSN
ncbi:Dbl homology domain-containing protein [Hesseltinella vesiculosa]|uniref:Dbl homology domain-containing protein n=1 Tax=Hesseltinella vesiculosa TaxID=101127 RepID=A0A1X2GIJ3_9FUNG|nr:Dbl homology domain-containing protein [Hesseltinella vesiculosa]